MLLLRPLTVCCLLVLLSQTIRAQETYLIKADSTRLTGCDSNELIIENHTQNVKGFLYNTGKGRTIFKPGIVKANDSLYIIGSDTLKYNAWLQGGNKWGKTGVLGTFDNNHLGLYTNSLERLRLTNTGNVLIGTTTDNGYDNLQVNGSIYNNFYTNISPSNQTSSGAIRLRWGTGDGAYIGFYYQGKTTRRAFLASPSDARPFLIEDSIMVSFRNTPKVSVGTETAFNDAKFSVIRPYHNAANVDVMSVGRLTTDTTFARDLMVKASGNVLVGGGTDKGYPFQVTSDGGAVVVTPTLSRAADMIRIGGGLNSGDGQNALIAVSDNGGAWKNVLVERNGYIGLGSSTTASWYVGNPTLRINDNGIVSVASQDFVLGSTGGPVNSSALVMEVSNLNEWTSGTSYPNGQNYYYFGTRLGTPSEGSKRAPLKIGGDELYFMSGATDTVYAKLAEGGNFGLGTTSPAAQLHTTGSVRFAGLSSDTTQTRVVMTDASGNLSYRPVSQVTRVTRFTPTGSSDSYGSVGDSAVDDNYFYYKTTTGWKRTALSGW